MIEIRNSILAGIAFGFLFGLFLAARFSFESALIVGPISGFAFGSALYFFVTSKTVKQQTAIQPAGDELIIHSGGANHFAGAEAVGGKLYLLTTKLHFKSHGFNIQNHELAIDLQQIKEISFYNSLGLIPNGISITMISGQKEKFVVNNRHLWKQKIENQKSRIVSINTN